MSNTTADNPSFFASFVDSDDTKFSGIAKKDLNACVLCQGTTRNLNEIIDNFYGRVTNAELARMVHAAHTQQTATSKAHTIRILKSRRIA